jgi:phage/conjugal plasmid C-4 type zinc finger TraR family protein
VMSARANLPAGEGLEYCEDCGEEIPERRRLALPGTRTCVACQSERDAHRVSAGINRRGSKDSQLR